MTVYAEPPTEPAAIVEVRHARGSADQPDLNLWLLAVGATFRLTPTLDVRALALGLTTTGSIATGTPARGGGGGELGLRLVPWTTSIVRAYVDASLGLLVFPGRRFLPGADVYEGIITFGLGLETRLPGGWGLALGGFSVHLSNGQGLGPHNPAYDGLGVALALQRVPVPITEEGGLPDEPPPPPDEPEPVALVAAEIGEGDGELLAGARGRLSVPWHSVGRAALEAAGGGFAGRTFAEFQGALVAALPWASLALAAGYRRFAEVDIGVITTQLEAHVAPQASLVGMAHHERSDGFGHLWRASLGVRAFPHRRVSVDLGVGFDRLGDDATFGDDHSDPYFGFEWLAYAPWRGPRISMFVERQVSTLNLIGVRVAPFAPDSLLARDRTHGWRPVR